MKYEAGDVAYYAIDDRRGAEEEGEPTWYGRKVVIVKVPPVNGWDNKPFNGYLVSVEGLPSTREDGYWFVEEDELTSKKPKSIKKRYEEI